MTTMSRRVMTILCLGLMAFIAIQSIEARSVGDHDFSSTRKLLGEQKKEIKVFKKERNTEVKALKQTKKTDNKGKYQEVLSFFCVTAYGISNPASSLAAKTEFKADKATNMHVRTKLMKV